MNPMLLFIALFVWIGATQEAGAVQIRSVLSGTPVLAAMLTDFQVLRPGDTLADAVQLTLTGSQRDFPVIDQGRVAGILTGRDMLAALEGYGQDREVTFIMRRNFPVAEAAEMLDVVFQRLQECGCQTIPVMRDGQLAGLITTDNLGEYLLIEATLQKRGTHVRLLQRTDLLTGSRVSRL
jgi:CBS domain-containing protein